MRLNKPVFLLIQLLILLGALAIVVVVMLYVTSSRDGMVHDTNTQAVLKRLETSASSYHRRLDSYEAMCGDIGVPEGFYCTETGSDFSIETTLTDGSYYCTDSTGYFGPNSGSVQGRSACR